jgi:hypothetical protein
MQWYYHKVQQFEEICKENVRILKKRGYTKMTLFCVIWGWKPTRTRTQNTEKNITLALIGIMVSYYDVGQTKIRPIEFRFTPKKYGLEWS